MGVGEHALSMVEHLSRQELEQHRARTLAHGEVLRVDEHLLACDSCQQRFVELAALPDASMQMSLPSSLDQENGARHLAYEQFAAYVDGTMDEVEREIADSHLLFCAQCVDEVEELREFSRQISQTPATQTSTRTVATESQRGFADGWRAWVSSFSPLKAGATLAALVLVAAAVWIIRRTVFQDTQMQVAQAPAPNSPDVKPPANDNRTTIDARKPENSNTGQTGNESIATGNANETNRNANEKSFPNNAPRVDETNAQSPVIALNDGARQVGLNRQGNLVGLETLSPATQQAVKESLTSQGLKKPAMLDDLSGQSGTLLDTTVEGIPFALTSPTGVVIESAQPVLRWQPLSGATAYVVSIFDENFKQIAKSEQLTGASWTPAQPLARGQVYSWQVTALKDGREIVSPTPPAPEARFKVLEAAFIREIAQARKLSSGSHLTLGILYARAGLIDEARRELLELIKQNPNSTLARSLLDSLQSWRRK